MLSYLHPHNPVSYPVSNKKQAPHLRLSFFDLFHIICATIFTGSGTYSLRIVFDFLSNHTSKLHYNSATSVSRPYPKSVSDHTSQQKLWTIPCFATHCSRLLFGPPDIQITTSASHTTILTGQILLTGRSLWFKSLHQSPPPPYQIPVVPVLAVRAQSIPS